MTFKNTWKIGIASLTLGCALFSAPVAQAQGPGGGQMPPEFQQFMKTMEKWQKDHKNLLTLNDMIEQLTALNNMDGYALDKNQAKKVLAVVKPWTTKGNMSEDDAKNVSKGIVAAMSTKQIQKMTTIETERQKRMRGGGFGGGGGGFKGGPGGAGKGGPGGGGGKKGGFKMGGFKLPQGWNPFNPSTVNEFMRDRSKQRVDAFMAGLEKRAKG